MTKKLSGGLKKFKMFSTVNRRSIPKRLVNMHRELPKTYPQKELTTTVLKLLIHGKDIKEYQPLPIGELLEEAQESLNKFCKCIAYEIFVFQSNGKLRSVQCAIRLI